MAPIPYFLSLLAAFLWMLLQFLAPKKKWSHGVLTLFFNLLSFSGVAWLLTSSHYGNEIAWRLRWFSIADANELFFSISIGLEQKYWLFLASGITLLAGIHHFVLRALAIKDGSEKTIDSGIDTGLPFFSIGSLLSIAAGNILTFSIGWSWLFVGAFLSIFVTRTGLDLKSNRTYRFFVFGALGEALLAIGALGVLNALPFDDLTLLTPNLVAEIPLWSHIAILTGIFFRQAFFPAAQSAAYLASAPGTNTYVAVYFQLLGLGILLQRFNLIFTESPIQLVAASAAIFSALLWVVSIFAEDNDNVFICGLSSFFSSIALCMAFSGSFFAAEVVILAAIFVVMAWGALYSPIFNSSKMPSWLFYILAATTAGLPALGFGWSKYDWYARLYAGIGETLFGQIMLPISIVIGIFFSAAVWGRIRLLLFEGGHSRFTYQAGTVMFFSMLSLIPPTSVSVTPEGLVPFFTVFGENLLGCLVAVLWLYRDEATGTTVVERWNRGIKRIFLGVDVQRQAAIDKIGGLLIKLFSTSLISIETSFERGILRKNAQGLVRMATHWFQRLEHGVIEGFIVKGLVRGLNGVATAVKYTHSGYTQFYFIFGAIVTALIIILLTAK